MCEHCELRLNGRCPVLNKAECPVNEWWKEASLLGEVKRELVAEAERIVTGVK